MRLKDVTKLIHSELNKYNQIIRLSIISAFNFNFTFRLDSDIDSDHQLIAEFNLPKALQCTYYSNNNTLWSKVNANDEDYKPIVFFMDLKTICSRFSDMNHLLYAHDVPLATRSDYHIAMISLLLRDQIFNETSFKPA